MTLDKAIKHGKEKRTPYRGAKSVDKSCRNHGGEDWALRDRTHKYRKGEVSAQDQLMTEECIVHEEWQIEKIQRAIVEADVGNFATDEEMALLDKKWDYAKK